MDTVGLIMWDLDETLNRNIRKSRAMGQISVAESMLRGPGLYPQHSRNKDMNKNLNKIWTFVSKNASLSAHCPWGASHPKERCY